MRGGSVENCMNQIRELSLGDCRSLGHFVWVLLRGKMEGDGAGLSLLINGDNTEVCKHGVLMY